MTENTTCKAKNTKSFRLRREGAHPPPRTHPLWPASWPCVASPQINYFFCIIWPDHSNFAASGPVACIPVFFNSCLQAPLCFPDIHLTTLAGDLVDHTCQFLLGEGVAWARKLRSHAYKIAINFAPRFTFALRMTRASSRNVGKLYTEH